MRPGYCSGNKQNQEDTTVERFYRDFWATREVAENWSNFTVEYNLYLELIDFSFIHYYLL